MSLTQQRCPNCQNIEIMEYLYDEPDPKSGNFKYLRCLRCNLVVIYIGEPERFKLEEQKILRERAKFYDIHRKRD